MIAHRRATVEFYQRFLAEARLHAIFGGSAQQVFDIQVSNFFIAQLQTGPPQSPRKRND